MLEFSKHNRDTAEHGRRQNFSKFMSENQDMVTVGVVILPMSQNETNEELMR